MITSFRIVLVVCATLFAVSGSAHAAARANPGRTVTDGDHRLSYNVKDSSQNLGDHSLVTQVIKVTDLQGYYKGEQKLTLNVEENLAIPSSKWNDLHDRATYQLEIPRVSPRSFQGTVVADVRNKPDGTPQAGGGVSDRILDVWNPGAKGNKGNGYAARWPWKPGKRQLKNLQAGPIALPDPKL